MSTTLNHLYPDLVREKSSDSPVDEVPLVDTEEKQKPYGVRCIEATVAAFTRWDRWVLFASLFLVACECSSPLFANPQTPEGTTRE